MGVFTFVCKRSGDDWSGKQLSGEVEASASSTFDLQRKLVQAALSTDSSGGVQSSFSLISPSSAVFQVIIGGGGGGGAFIGGGGAAPAAASGAVQPQPRHLRLRRRRKRKKRAMMTWDFHSLISEVYLSKLLAVGNSVPFFSPFEIVNISG